MEEVRIAVVGAGNVAQQAHLPAFKKIRAAKVVALVDRQKTKAKYVAERFGIPSVYHSLTDLLRNEEVDAIDICTPTDTHKDLALEALAAGCDVFIERPIARTAQEAYQIVEAARKAGRIVMVGMRHRFRNDLLLLKTEVEQQQLGELQYLHGFWHTEPSSSSRWFAQKERSGGGVLTDLGIVLLDLFLWFVPATVRSLYCSTRHLRLRKLEDFAVVVLELENNAVAEFTVSWSLPLAETAYQIELYGKKGIASLRPLRILTTKDGHLAPLPLPARPRNQYALYQQSYLNELQHFINAVRAILPPASTAEEALERMQLLEACYQSAESGQAVTPALSS